MIDQMIARMDAIIQKRAPVDQKIDQLDQLVQAQSATLSQAKNPADAEKLELAAKRIAAIGADERIERIAKALTGYAEDIRLPSEVLQLIVSQTDVKTFRGASKETHRMAMEAYRGPLRDLKLTTAAQAIAFTREFGQKLPYLDIGGIRFSKEQLEALVPLLPNLTTLLASGCGIGNEGVKAIATLKTVTTLDLSKNSLFGESGVEALAPLTHLQALDLSKNMLNMEGAEALARAPLTNLQTLRLYDTSIGRQGMVHIASSTTLTSLKSLDLDSNPGGDEAARKIATSETFKNLEKLNLRNTDLTNAGVKELASSKNLTNLKVLNLGFARIFSEGFDAIAASQNLSSLEELDFSNVYNISSRDMHILCNTPTLSHLQTLIFFARFEADGARRIAESPYLTNLRHLELHGCRIGDAGAEAIANSQRLKNLQFLDLTANGIGEAGARAIARSPTLKNLQSLNIRANEIGDAGAVALATLQQLKELTLYHCKIGEAGALALALSRTPLLHLEHNDDIGARGQFTLSHHARLAALTEAERQKLFDHVYSIAVRQNWKVLWDAWLDPEWAKQHLFEDQLRFNEALRKVFERIS